MWHQRDLRGREGQRCVSCCSALIAFMQTSQSTWLLCQPQCQKLKGGGGVEPIFAFYSPRLWLMVWSCFKHAEFCTAIHCSLGLTSWNWNVKSSWTLNSSQVCSVTSDGKRNRFFFILYHIIYTRNFENVKSLVWKTTRNYKFCSHSSDVSQTHLVHIFV